ncbi:MAG: glycosyltransferase [Euryarchaeota archaeon]|nr:glycosyltransferase [Euryarchaeota archaeon]MDE1838000.1 glycosyltransferase [Euryarchaeota archaeon]MDE1880646.1 glycosyltransferase [Euryarchaeota archaeon]MDE2046455.1 glycosyltransferase [Thermoplasmata archaeon]
MRTVAEGLWPWVIGPALVLPDTPLGWALPLLYFLLIFLGQGAIVYLAIRMPALEPSDLGESSKRSLVSVIIPARNEREDLARCLDDLRGQDWIRSGGALEILVVDGGSSDGTADMARSHPSQPTVIDEPPLPPGWVGKNWACHQGAQRARGDLLLFLDADVRLAPGAVRAAVAQQASTGADLLTLAARVVMEGFWERVVMPLYVQFVLLYFVAPRVNNDRSSRAMANGQFMFFSRAGYQRSGGHEGVRGAVLEDVRLAQEVKRRGGRLRIFWAPELISTRMYSDRAEMDEGILKNLHGTRFSLGRQVGLSLAIFVYFLSPFVVVALALLGLVSFLWFVFGLALIGVTALKQVAFQGAIRAPRAYGLLYPIGCAYYLGLFARSVRLGLKGGKVQWKGREYNMDA